MGLIFNPDVARAVRLHQSRLVRDCLGRLAAPLGRRGFPAAVYALAPVWPRGPQWGRFSALTLPGLSGCT